MTTYGLVILLIGSIAFFGVACWRFYKTMRKAALDKARHEGWNEGMDDARRLLLEWVKHERR